MNIICNILTSSQVCHGLPLPPRSYYKFLILLYPTVLCPFFQHIQTTLVFPFVCSFLCLVTPGNLSTHITHPTYPSCHFFPALLSSLLSLPKSHHHREQHMPGKLYYMSWVKHLGGKYRQKFSIFLPALMLSSKSPPALIVSPK